MPVPEGGSLVGPTACNRTIPVYDGYIRFNVSLHYVGVKQISIEGYSGPVSVCSARYYPISGHKRDLRSTRIYGGKPRHRAWLAPIPQAHIVVPVHVALMTLAGAAVIDAVSFSIEPSAATATTTHYSAFRADEIIGSKRVYSDRSTFSEHARTAMRRSGT